DELDGDEQRRLVRERYAGLASGGSCSGGSCCGDGDDSAPADSAANVERLGYDGDDVAAAADAAELSLGCGNP
ncbi:hypothetical protein ACSRB1_22275, partial [Salmonella enterica]